MSLQRGRVGVLIYSKLYLLCGTLLKRPPSYKGPSFSLPDRLYDTSEWGSPLWSHSIIAGVCFNQKSVGFSDSLGIPNTGSLHLQSDWQVCAGKAYPKQILVSEPVNG